MADKSFPLFTVLSVATGHSWGGSFSDIHECAEHVMGHPIWTHEFASAPLWEEMRRRVLASHPCLADVTPDTYPTSNDNLGERLAPQVARFGETLTIPAGIGERVIVVSTPTPPAKGEE